MKSASLSGSFEKQSAIIIGTNELVQYFPQVMVDIVTALADHIPLIALVDSEEQRQNVILMLTDWGLPAHGIHFVSLPVKGMWVRDYGPSFVRDSNGRITILDAEYLEADRPNDDLAPVELAALLKLPVVHVPLTVEGGNLLSNGRGLGVTTTTLMARNVHRGYNQKKVTEMLGQYYKLKQLLVLEPLKSEPTGHADMFLTFVSPNVAVVGAYDSRVDPVNADVLDYNAQLLARTQTSEGPIQVHRIPMPTNHGGVWRTYTNVVYANGRLLMPVFPGVDPAGQEQAMRLYSSLLPGWEVIGINANTLIHNRGAIRCVTLNVPWLEEVFEARSDRGRPRIKLLSALAL